VAETLTKAIAANKVNKYVQWIGFEPDWHEFVEAGG